jgi:hypothetical protein
MEKTIIKTIILTTRIFELREFSTYARNIKDKSLQVNYYSYNYRSISRNDNQILILLNGSQLDNPEISITSLTNFAPGQCNNKDKIDIFLKLIEKLAEKEKFKVDENLIVAIHWGKVGILDSKKYTENIRKWIDSYFDQVNFIITFWTTAAEEPEPDKLIEEKLKNPDPCINPEEFEQWFNILKQRIIPLTTKISRIKHYLMHLLGPIDNDLQGLWDEAERHNREGFCPEKWNEFYQIYKDYDWNRVLNDALELIKKELENMEMDLSPDNKKEIYEFLESINRVGGELTNDIAHCDNKFVVLLKNVNKFILNIKDNQKNEVYKKLKDNNGLNPIHIMFKELDRILEKFI